MATALLAGTALTANEADIVAGGKTVTLELTGATWAVAAGTPTYSAATTQGTTAADSAGGGGGRTGNGDLTCTFPSGYTPTAGHFAVLAIYNDPNGAGLCTSSTPADWTPVTGNPFGTPQTLYLFTKLLVGGEGSPVSTIAGSGTNISHCANIVIYTGVGSVGAIGTPSYSTGSPMTAAAITTTANASIVCAFNGRGDNEAVTANPTFGGSTTGVNKRLDGGTGAGSDSEVSMIDITIATSGTSSGASSCATSITDPWVSVQIELKPSAPFADARTAIRNGLVAAEGEAAGWNVKVAPNIPVANVVRSSDTVCTITLQAQADYNITSQETITATIPAAATSAAAAIVAQPYFIVTNTAGGQAGAAGPLPSIGLVFEAAVEKRLTAAAGAFTWAGTVAAFDRRVTAASGAYTWTGNAAAFKRRMAAPAGAFSWAGTAVTFKRTYVPIAAASGAFTWAGTTPTLKTAHTIAAASGAYTWTATAPALKTAHSLAGAAGSFTWIGTAPAVKRSMAAGAGSFTWTGSAPSMNKATASSMAASAGAFTWAGTAVALSRTHASLAANAGTFTWAGTAPTLTKVVAHPMSAAAGAYTWAGTSPTLTAAQMGRSGGAAFLPSLSTLFEFAGNYSMTAASGAFTWTGTAAALRSPTRLTASAGAFTWIATSPTLTPLRSVEVFWDDITGEDGYRVKWGTAAGTYPNSADVAADASSYTITGLTERTTYHWIVMGLLGGVEQTPTDDQVFTVGIPPLIADAMTFSWTGSAPTLTKSAARTLPASIGTFTWSGTAPTLRFAHKTAGTAGSYTWTGTAPVLTLRHVYSLAATAGAFTWVGTDASLTKAGARTLAATAGAYIWTPSAPTLRFAHKMPGATGTFTWAGTAPALKKARQITATAGTYTWSTSSPTLRFAHKMPAPSAAFTWTATSPALAKQRRLVATAGAFTWTPTAPALKRPRRVMTATAGAFTLYGDVYIYTNSASVSGGGAVRRGGRRPRGQFPPWYPFGEWPKGYEPEPQPDRPVVPELVFYTMRAAPGAFTCTGNDAGFETTAGIRRLRIAAVLERLLLAA